MYYIHAPTLPPLIGKNPFPNETLHIVHRLVSDEYPSPLNKTPQFVFDFSPSDTKRSHPSIMTSMSIEIHRYAFSIDRNLARNRPPNQKNQNQKN